MTEVTLNTLRVLRSVGNFSNGHGFTTQVLNIILQGCDVIGDDWFRFHGTADISSCRNIAQELVLIISGPEAGVDMYFDKIEVTNYARDRSWKPAADLRIDELRKNDVTFKAGSPYHMNHNL